MSRSDAYKWVEKSRSDIDVVKRALAPNPAPNLEAAAYHCQQAAEKAVKALLVHLSVAFARGGGKGHDIRILARNIPRKHALYGAAWSLAHLTPWATVFRNPSDDPAAAPPVPSVSDIARELNLNTAFLDQVEAEIGDDVP
ncbi:MAG TPA: HEPN domain-containing protein [Methylocystis sp.]|nr:HEPN domain-containing protein [Methylocystis sp.]